MKGIQRSLRDKPTNNLVVAVLLGFSTVLFIQDVASTWDQGPSSYWHGQLWRDLIAYAVVLVVAEAVSRMAK
jgi:hypothetical protein